MNFNENQLKAINHYEGNCCVLSSAGSGKTSVLTNRIVNLINVHNVKPENILAITFSVKARENMQERLLKLIGDKSSKITIETFHALGNKILRECSYNYFHNKIKVWQQKQFINNIVVKTLKMESNEKNVDTNDILKFISCQKNNLLDCNDELLETKYMPYSINIMQYIYQRYEEIKKDEKAMDFDDMLLYTYKLLANNDSTREKYQDRYRFISIDEHQDSSVASYEILRLLGKKYNNVFVVGDPLQCLLPNTLISTSDGNKEIKDINQNDNIIVAYGRGGKIETQVSSVLNKYYEGKIVKIITKSGNILEGTPNHCIFTKQFAKEGLYYVYLMYKKEYGYRIGITSSARSGNGKRINGYEGRLNQEYGDAIWILEECDNLEDTKYYELYYSYLYGIPTNLFIAREGMNQNIIDRLFENINTRNNVKKLMEDKLLFEDIPYHKPKAGGGVKNNRINFTMFEHSTVGKCNYINSHDINNKYIHRHGISIDTSNDDYKHCVEKFIKFNFKRNMNGYEYFRATKNNFNYDYLFQLINNIENECINNNVDVKVALNAKITDILYEFTPMSYARRGMTIPIETDDGIVDDEIELVEIYDYKGLVYDINVDYYRNYIANGIVVHNCIYEWNLANNNYLIDFHKDWIDTTIIPLNINYRSSQDIVELSNKLVKNTKETTHKYYYESVAYKPKYKSPEFSCFTDEIEEANYISSKIIEMSKLGNNYSDFAILTRTNFQIQAIERSLYKNNIPYQIVGGTTFFEIKEINDMVSYLRLVKNINNDDAFKQIYNSPNRYLGSVFLNEVNTYASKYDKSLFVSMLSFPRSNEWRYKNGISEIQNIILKIKNKKKSKVGDLINIIRKDLDYDKYILKEDSESNIRSEKIDNLNILVNLANKYNSIDTFLEEVDNLLGFSKDSDVVEKVKVMTCHKSKGLEFKIVFLPGVNDGLLPHSKSDNEAEERRLFYVGMTRAEKELFISSTMFYGNRQMGISKFIFDIFEKEYIRERMIEDNDDFDEDE